MTLRRLILCFALAAVAGGLAPSAPSALADEDFAASFHADYERAARKLVALAEAIPADEYDWRPAEGVRSVGEVLAHTAYGNFFFPSRLGAEMPADVGRDVESRVTAKEDVLALLRRSVANVEAFVASQPDLDRRVEIAGNQFRAREVMFIIAGHTHEHLGQTIAYARTIGVKPPWDSPLGPPEEGE